MCLKLPIDLARTDGGFNLFKSLVEVDANGLVILYKLLECMYRSDVFRPPFWGSSIRLEEVTYSDRNSRELSHQEKLEGRVHHGLHMYVNEYDYMEPMILVYAIVHLDDFVAANVYEAVFMKAIYTKMRPTEEKMKQYIRMLNPINQLTFPFLDNE